MQRHYYEMSNESLAMLAAAGNQDAAVERMIREVMFVDQVHWRMGALKVQEMEALSGGTVTQMLRFPYTVGTFVSLGAAFMAVPMCFSVDTALWFNEHFVTFEVRHPPFD